jgi:hypothetical protein
MFQWVWPKGAVVLWVWLVGVVCAPDANSEKLEPIIGKFTGVGARVCL